MKLLLVNGSKHILTSIDNERGISQYQYLRAPIPADSQPLWKLSKDSIVEGVFGLRKIEAFIYKNESILNLGFQLMLTRKYTKQDFIRVFTSERVELPLLGAPSLVNSVGIYSIYKLVYRLQINSSSSWHHKIDESYIIEAEGFHSQFFSPSGTCLLEYS